jgi:hypothetical protein
MSSTDCPTSNVAVDAERVGMTKAGETTRTTDPDVKAYPLESVIDTVTL